LDSFQQGQAQHQGDLHPNPKLLNTHVAWTQVGFICPPSRLRRKASTRIGKCLQFRVHGAGLHECRVAGRSARAMQLRKLAPLWLSDSYQFCSSSQRRTSPTSKWHGCLRSTPPPCARSLHQRTIVGAGHEADKLDATRHSALSRLLVGLRTHVVGGLGHGSGQMAGHGKGRTSTICFAEAFGEEWPCPGATTVSTMPNGWLVWSGGLDRTSA